MFKVSVIVPVYNAEKTIKRCLNSLVKQNFTRNKYEIIVVDDGSTDDTVSKIKKFKKVRLVQQEHKGPAAARNLGAKIAKGELILFTDADCVPDRNWIRTMIKPFEDKDIVGTGGTYKTLNKNSLIARFIGYEIERRHKELARQKHIDFIGTYSAAYRKDIFLKFGGFDESFPLASGEDPELSFRLAEKGYKMVFNPKAIVYHTHPNTLLKFMEQQFWRGYWRVFLYSKHMKKLISHSYTPRSLYMEILFVGASLLFLFLTFIQRSFFPVSISFLFLWFLLILKPLLYYCKKEKKLLILGIPIIFLRDLSIGFGIMCGIFKKVLRLDKK